MIKKIGLIFRKTVKLFEYKKNNERYWDEPKLYKQLITKVFLTAEALYLGYLLLFLIDNAMNHSIYINNVFCITEIN